MAITPAGEPAALRALPASRGQKLAARMWRERYVYLLVLPGVLYFIVYKYIPMFGIVIAFKDFSPFLGFWDSEWVGFKHFHTLFSDPHIARYMWNTLYLNFLQVAFAFPMGIAMALMLNELASEKFKRVIQSIVYLPHFLSWVVVVSIFVVFFKQEGFVNHVLKLFGAEPISFLMDPGYFMPMVLLEGMWKETGFGTIIFLAALSAVDPHLYEAAVVDGAGRWRKMWHITLPAIRPTIVILLILQLGHSLDSGVEQIYLMLNSFTQEVGTTLDVFVFIQGIFKADFSFASAVGVFKSVVGLVLIVAANRLAKRFGEEGVY